MYVLSRFRLSPSAVLLFINATLSDHHHRRRRRHRSMVAMQMRRTTQVP